MERARYEHKYSPEETPLARVHAEFGRILLRVLKGISHINIERKYLQGQDEVLLNPSLLRITPISSVLNRDKNGYYESNRAMITDHLGNPLTPICFFRTGKDLKELLGANFRIFLVEVQDETDLPYTSKKIPVFTDIFIPPNKLFPKAFRRIAFHRIFIGAFKPRKNNPLENGTWKSRKKELTLK